MLELLQFQSQRELLQLLYALLQQLKLNYLAQMNRAGIDALMDELDELTAPISSAEPPATPPA